MKQMFINDLLEINETGQDYDFIAKRLRERLLALGVEGDR